jgi:hypothetical protein
MTTQDGGPGSSAQLSSLRRWAVRAFTAYFALYTIPWLIGTLPLIGRASGWWFTALNASAHWLLVQVFGLPPHSPPVPDYYLDHVPDSLVELTGCGLLLLIAVTGSALWTAVRRDPLGDRRLFAWSHTLIRFSLAGVMMRYGWGKLLPQQFNGGDVPLPWMLWRLGDFSPQHLLWIYMGYSRPYAIFCGAGEMLGALLLCSRRTTALGALVLIGVLSNVVAINFAYDVPLKVWSTHLLLTALFIAAPDVPRLTAVFLKKLAVGEGPFFPTLARARHGDVGLSITGGVLSLWLLLSPLPGVSASINGLHLRRPALPGYAGLFNVEPTHAAVDPAWSGWRSLAVSGRSMTVLTDADSLITYALVADTTAHRLVLTSRDSARTRHTLVYAADSTGLTLQPVGSDTGQGLRLRRFQATLLRWQHRWGW